MKDMLVNHATLQVPGAQDQFLTVLSREEAASRFQSHLAMEPLGERNGWARLESRPRARTNTSLAD